MNQTKLANILTNNEQIYIFAKSAQNVLIFHIIKKEAKPSLESHLTFWQKRGLFDYTIYRQYTIKRQTNSSKIKSQVSYISQLIWLSLPYLCDLKNVDSQQPNGEYQRNE